MENVHLTRAHSNSSQTHPSVLMAEPSGSQNSHTEAAEEEEVEREAGAAGPGQGVGEGRQVLQTALQEVQ